jgi:signal transduction histidine kinase
MVRGPRGSGLWAILALLAALLAVLAALQYRWIGEVSRADAERRRAQLDRGAHNFAASLDREIARLYLAFRVEPGPPPRAREGELVERFRALRGTSEHPGLASWLALASRRPDGPARFERCRTEEDRCEASPWPADLSSLRERLDALEEERPPREPSAGRILGLLDPPLVVVVPTVGAPDETAGPGRRGRFRVNGLVVVGLDPAYLRDHLLPQLAEAQFGPPEESEYVVGVFRVPDGSLLYASDAEAVRETSRPELTLDLPGGFPRERRGTGPPRDRRPDDAPPPPGGPFERLLREGPPPAREGPWQLRVWHKDGSLEAAVESVRRRNLAVGLGVLALLGTAAAVLVAGAQRARQLARQQLEFVSGVTHELNTPLAAIRSAGQNLADGIVSEPDRVRRYGDLIHREGERLSGLVAQVLDFAGIDSGSRAFTFEAVPLRPLVDKVVGDLALVLEQAGLEVEIDVAEDVPPVRGDAAALRRVLGNLLTNAAKFASEGGRVAVRARRPPARGPVELQVEDAGPGIPKDERQRVLEPFYRGRAAVESGKPGSGLGLSVVRHAVEAHGGRVRVEGREGGGTRVVVQLPLDDAGGRS